MRPLATPTPFPSPRLAVEFEPLDFLLGGHSVSLVAGNASITSFALNVPRFLTGPWSIRLERGLALTKRGRLGLHVAVVRARLVHDRDPQRVHHARYVLFVPHRGRGGPSSLYPWFGIAFRLGRSRVFPEPAWFPVGAVHFGWPRR